jgi:hypothetical protein
MYFFCSKADWFAASGTGWHAGHFLRLLTRKHSYASVYNMALNQKDIGDGRAGFLPPFMAETVH